MQHEAHTILLGLRYGIGDVVMEIEAIRSLRAAAPRGRITAVGAPPALEILEGEGLVDELESIRRWGLSHRWDPGDAGKLRSIAEWIDEKEFEIFIDMNQLPPAFGTVVWSRGIRSLESAEEAEAAVVASGGDGVRAIHAGVREGWGVEVPPDVLPRLGLTPGERLSADRLLESWAIEGAPLGVSPVASLGLKRWPVERFAQAMERVAGEIGAPVLLFCGPQEEVGREMLEHTRLDLQVVTVGALHLRTVAALLARCRAFLCNDTGLMHLAAAVGTPTVAVFGPTPPGVYRPPAPHVVAVGGEEIACPHRNTRSLGPPGCWSEDRCLIAAEGCIHAAGVGAVVGALRRALRPGPRGRARSPAARRA